MNRVNQYIGKLAFSLLFFSAIAWLITLRMMGADGVLQNVSGTTTTGGSVNAADIITNANIRVFTNLNAIVTTNGSATATAIRGVVSDVTSGFIFVSANDTALLSAGVGVIRVADQSGLRVRQNLKLASDNLMTTSPDAGVGRSAVGAGIVEANTSTLGTLGFFLASGYMVKTNYTPADWSSVAGYAKIVFSNGIPWKVTQISTQLVNAASTP